MGNFGRCLGWILMAVLVMLAPVRQASGDEEHARLVKSIPMNHEALLQSPQMIQAWFSEVLAAKGSVMRLYDRGRVRQCLCNKRVKRETRRWWTP